MSDTGHGGVIDGELSSDEETPDCLSFFLCACCGCGTQEENEATAIGMTEPHTYSPVDASATTEGGALSLVEMRVFTLPIDYNAQQEFVRLFTRGDSFQDASSPRRTYSVSTTDDMLKDARDALLQACEDARYPQSARMSPRDLYRHLFVYERAISQAAQDMERRALYIGEYELFKAQLDVDNLHDAGRARVYTDLLESPKTGPADRLEYYRKAILYTNELGAKEALRKRYKEYCEQLKEVY